MKYRSNLSLRNPKELFQYRLEVKDQRWEDFSKNEGHRRVSVWFKTVRLEKKLTSREGEEIGDWSDSQFKGKI